MITEQPARIVLRTLTKAGWSLKRKAKGSHEFWMCPTGAHTVTVSTGHGAVSPGVVRKVHQAIDGCSCDQKESP